MGRYLDLAGSATEDVETRTPRPFAHNTGDGTRGNETNEIDELSPGPLLPVDDLDAGRTARQRHEQAAHNGESMAWWWRPPSPDERATAPAGWWACTACRPSAAVGDDPSPPATLPAIAAMWEPSYVDPRHDLTEDSALWSRLLAAAWCLDGTEPAGLFGALHGLRCLGARLVVDGGRVKLLAGSIPAAEYARDRERWLLPHVATLSRLLAKLSAARGGQR